MNFKRYHESKNLFDENAIQNGYYGSTGSISTFKSDDRYRAFQMSIKAGTYTIKIQADEGIRLLRIATANEFYNVQEENIAYTFVISSDAIVYVSWRNLSTTSSFTNMTVMLNTGSQPLPYEPYSSEVWHDIPNYIHNTSTDTITTLPAVLYPNAVTATVGLKGDMSQTGTPTPTTPIQPQECGERTTQLFDISSEKTIGGKIAYDCSLTIGQTYTFTNCSDYELGFKISVAATSYNSVIKVPLQPNESYTFTMARNPNIPEGSTQYFFIIIDSVYGVEVDEGDVMLNAGSTPLPYEPYGIKIPILSNSTTTPVYLGEVQSTRRVKKLVLTGDEDWQLQSINSHGIANFWVFDYLTGINSDRSALCTHFYQTTASIADVTEPCFSISTSSASLYLRIQSTTASDATQFKTWLAQQYAAGTPVCVWYVLATETTGIVNEPLRKIGTYADEVSGITIPTTAGANTLSVDTTLQPSEVTVNYKGWHPVADVHERESGQWD